MNKTLFLLSITIVLILTGCGAAVSDNTTAATNVPSSVSTTIAVTEPTTAPTEKQVPTVSTTAPTESEEREPRQQGFRLNEEQLAYFEELFNLHFPKPVECYYNLVLNQEFASVQDIDLNAFFEDGSPAYAKYEITDSECEHYAQATGNPWPSGNIDRMSHAFVEDVLQRYLGIRIPQMNMSTLAYNPATGCYYRAGSGTYRHSPPDFTDGYYDEETGLISLYFVGGFEDKERIVTLRYKPEAEDIKFLIVSNLPIR